jgi:hypothetical protein
MVLPDEPSAADLAAYLEDEGSSALHFLPGWFAGMGGWSIEERARVLEAASNNQATTDLADAVAQLSPVLAEGLVSRIVISLRYVETITFFSSTGVCNPPVVDVLLDGILDMKDHTEASAATSVHLLACSRSQRLPRVLQAFPSARSAGVREAVLVSCTTLLPLRRLHVDGREIVEASCRPRRNSS